jgi:hypothetical protein
MREKTIVVLANSYKRGGRCIAGKEVTKAGDNQWNLTHTWIRPVSEDLASHGAVSDAFYKIGGQDIYLMDIVTVSLIDHLPEPGQPENWLIDASIPWISHGQFNASVCSRLLDSPNDVWLDQAHVIPTAAVSYQYEQQSMITDSLKLIQPHNLLFHLKNDFNEHEGRFERKLSASFRYNGQDYSGLSVTDPIIRRILGRQFPEEGAGEIMKPLNNGDAYWLCVSLSPRFGVQNRRYKLVAGVIDQTGYLLRRR